MLGIKPGGHPREAPREAKGAPLPKHGKTEHAREARKSMLGIKLEQGISGYLPVGRLLERYRRWASATIKVLAQRQARWPEHLAEFNFRALGPRP
jgi:hypothetical protein